MLRTSSAISSASRRLGPRFFSQWSAAAISPPYRDLQFLKVNGKTVPLPPHSTNAVNTKQIAYAGLDTLDILFDVEDARDEECNAATLEYRRVRALLLPGFFSRWCAVTGAGQIALGESEKTTRRTIEAMSPGREYHIDCLGCEVMEYVIMDTQQLGFDPSNTSPPTAPGVHENQFYISGEHSFGEDAPFQQALMKHDTGAQLVGIPREVISNPPAGMVLERGKINLAIGPAGSTKGRSFNNQYIRVNGLVTKTTVIESREWLVGFPVIARFRTVLDVTAESPLVMEPLPGQVDHE
ncbi:hypothetical protein B484DRAFT_457563 [Ochromonadaceae sp. CCMP2298]|nr:hypothetical protein B484DRAFT_457563 [Ochromonadaceae sp. CCMP2298]